MTWRDDLRRVTFPDGRRMVGASFRGVPFFVPEHDRGGGRRAVVSEFPFKDEPHVDDLGRAARTFRLEGYVLGDDYIDQRDSLIEALEDIEGPGELVHPYHGIKRAICERFSQRDTVDDGGMAIFSMEFIETPAQAAGANIQPDFVALVDVAADAALLATVAAFAADYDVDGMPSFSLRSIEDALVAATEAVGEAMSPITGVTQEMARMQQDIRIITAQASSLVRTPGEILTAFRDTFGALVDTALSLPFEVMDALVGAYGFDAGVRPPSTTATRRREQGNWDRLTSALRRVLAIEAARLAPRVSWPTYDEAVAARDTLAERLDAEAAVAGDDAYRALTNLRTQLERAVPGDEQLARTITVERPVAVPSLLVAYQVYGSVDRELEIVERNRIRHPGFVAGEIGAVVDE